MIEIKYGLFTAFVLFIWTLIEYTLLVPNFHEYSPFTGFVSALIPVIGIYFGIRERREKANYGYIRFKEAFITGIAITFIIAVLLVIFVYVYYEFIEPDFVNKLAAETEKNLIQKNVGREEINAVIEELKYRYSFSMQLIQQLLFILIGGTAVSVILSLILKKAQRHKQFET